MGTFFTPLEILSDDESRSETVQALVDTGASVTVLPAPLLERLGVRRIRPLSFEIASGETITRDMGLALVRLDGWVQPTPVLFGNADQRPLLGAMTLQEFFLGVDTVEHRLVPTTGLALGLRT